MPYNFFLKFDFCKYYSSELKMRGPIHNKLYDICYFFLHKCKPYDTWKLFVANCILTDDGKPGDVIPTLMQRFKKSA